MDVHLTSLESVKSTDAMIVVSDGNSSQNATANVIILFPHMYDECPSHAELTNALAKRFKDYKMRSLAICCICSLGYSVNHHNIDIYTSKDFKSIWGHIETLETSSSPSLSDWLHMCISSRSQDGYEYSTNNSTEHASSTSIQSKSRYKPRSNVFRIGYAFSNKYFGSSDTIIDAMKADALLLATAKFVSSDKVLPNSAVATVLSQQADS